MDQIYSPLNTSRSSIRLLKLHPGIIDAEIECELHVASLDDDPQYEAISYAWGLKSSKDKSIKLAGYVVPLGDNLFSALNYLRYPDRPRIVWADALCINQDDVEEKTRQVQIMGRIYTECTQCLIWLGDRPKNSGEGTQFCRRDAKAMFDLLRLMACKKPPDVLPATLRYPFQRTRAAHAFASIMLCGNDWWQRIWTVQEVVLAPRRTLVWNTLDISWDICLQASRKLGKPSYPLEKFLQQLEPELSGRVLAQIVLPILGLHMTKVEALKDPISILQLWRFPSDLPSITCDYKTSTADVFIAMTLDLIRLSGNLLPLVGWRGQMQMTPGLPTWTLDMVPPKNEALISRVGFSVHKNRFEAFKADDEMPLELQISNDKYILILCGLFIDKIATIDAGYAIWDDWTTIESEDAIQISKRREQLLSNFMKTQSPSGAYIGGGNWRYAFWRTLLGDLIEKNDGVRIPAHSDGEHFKAFMDHGTQIEVVRRSLYSMLLNQTFFITQQGYIGIGPRNLRVGDEAWILAGSRLPFILRPTMESGPDAKPDTANHTFIGDAHVQGVIDGEFAPAGRNNFRSVSLR